MAGIRVHTSSPINQNSATGATPQTSQAGAPLGNSVNASTPASAPATTTAAPYSQYPPAQPGAAAVPAPTSTASSAYAPTTPTPTRTVPPPASHTYGGPAPPQPGAVPMVSPYRSSPNNSIPPPPKANEVPKPAAYYAPQPAGATATPLTSAYPQTTVSPLTLHQQYPNMSTPSRAVPPSSTTSSAFDASPYSQLPLAPPPADLSHPPGYVQNSSSLETYRPSAFDNHTSTPPRGGILDTLSNYTGGDAGGGGGSGIWDTAVSWAKTAGEKLSHGEEEVWKVINGEK